MWWIIGGIVVILLLLVVRARRNRLAHAKIVSLVLMLKEPRLIDAQAVRRAATKAFGLRVGSSTDEEHFVVQLSPETMPVRVFGLPLGFICSNKRYSEVPESDLATMDARLADVLRQHQGWLGLDHIGDQPPPEAKQKVYQVIARLLSEFLDDNCLGVWCPEVDKLMFNYPGMKEALRREDPLAALEMTEAPVMQADYDDPKLKATIEEAQRRWPEFVGAFDRRRPGQNFGVKLKFTDGDETEFMWVVVESINGDVVRGMLDNSPFKLKNIKSGASVTAEQKDVLDWMYEEGEEMRGGFSLKVLAGA